MGKIRKLKEKEVKEVKEAKEVKVVEVMDMRVMVTEQQKIIKKVLKNSFLQNLSLLL